LHSIDFKPLRQLSSFYPLRLAYGFRILCLSLSLIALFPEKPTQQKEHAYCLC
jgi:hypothetical protein